jgi:hypothetical protein
MALNNLCTASLCYQNILPHTVVLKTHVLLLMTIAMYTQEDLCFERFA